MSTSLLEEDNLTSISILNIHIQYSCPPVCWRTILLQYSLLQRNLIWEETDNESELLLSNWGYVGSTAVSVFGQIQYQNKGSIPITIPILKRGPCLRICDLLVLHLENLPLVLIRGTDCHIRNTFCQWWQSFLRPRSDRRCRSQSRRCNVSSPPSGPGNLRHDVYSSQLEIEIKWYPFQLLP